MQPPTLGIEEEFLLVDARTGDLRNDADQVLGRAGESAGDGAAGGFEHELRTAMVETGSAVCTDPEQVAAELHRRRATTVKAAAEVGARLLASGCHPRASPATAGYTDESRYRRMATEYGPLADESLVCGCHVHVSVPDRESGVAVIDRIRPWLPVLVALSANSPLWLGRDTGYDSWRTQVWSRWPTAGPTSLFGSAENYDARAEALIAGGAVLDRGMLYYQARLSEHWPTVEIRVADVCLDVDDAVLIGALARALVMTASTAVGPVDDVPVELLRAATFVASRSGLRDRLVDPSDWRARPAGRVIDGLLDHVRGALEETGDLPQVEAGVGRLHAAGTGADRQRAALRRGGIDAVLDLVAL